MFGSETTLFASATICKLVGDFVSNRCIVWGYLALDSITGDD